MPFGVRALEALDFGLSWTAGPFDTSCGACIDTMLRTLQEQREGRGALKFRRGDSEFS